MGVHGLWRLLDSFGTVIQPEDLKGKRVAIDASIWIVQFRARVAPGEDVEHKIVEGFLARILKLLFYGIHPVFVFDGHASANKGAEHQRRMRQRALNEQAQLKRRAKQILMAQVAAGSINVEALRRAVEEDAVASKKAESTHMLESAEAATGVTTAGEDEGGVAAAAAAADEIVKVTDAAVKRPSKRHEKRRRATEGSSTEPSSHHHRHHKHRRRHTRRRLAPDAVSARSTVHFLQDVEGLLEDRAKQEARVLHNALHHTSTSLFMGPRQAVDEGEAAAHTGSSVAPSPPSCAVVVDDEAEVISVTGSDECEDDEGDATSSSSLSSSCCAVLFREVSGSEEDVVEVEPRPTASLSSTTDFAKNAAGLHSDDLGRFLASLSQRGPSASATPPSPPSYQVEDCENSAARWGKSATLLAEVEGVVMVDSDSDRDGDAPDALDESSCEVDASAESGDSAEEEEATDSSSGSDASTWTDEVEEEEEEETMDPSEAADKTWDPFTQRITAFLPQLDSAEATTGKPPQGTPEPQQQHGTEKNSEDDDDYTPVKLGQPFAARPSAALVAKPAVTTVVSSSEEDERSNSVVFIADAPPAAPIRGGGGSNDVKVCADSPPHATSRPSSSSAPRRSVSIVPFDLLHIVELLDCCGVPYVLSPAEADAQCAFLARQGLVDAVFTEDSDVLVHGATTVLRGFFAQSKSVVAYRQSELAACGITKTVLVALASLLGCDYTEGVQGIGLVGALEALVVAWTALENRTDASDSPTPARHVLRRWRSLVQQPPCAWEDVDEDMTVAQFALLRSAVTQWHLLEQRPTFPERQPIEVFYDAEVDDDVTPFTWLPPDWQQIRIFAGALGALSSTWLVQRYELARKECLKREAEEAAAAQERGQRRLTEYGARERVRAEWAFQKQPHRHTAILSQLRAVQLLR